MCGKHCKSLNAVSDLHQLRCWCNLWNSATATRLIWHERVLCLVCGGDAWAAADSFISSQTSPPYPATHIYSLIGVCVYVCYGLHLFLFRQARHHALHYSHHPKAGPTSLIIWSIISMPGSIVMMGHGCFKLEHVLPAESTCCCCLIGSGCMAGFLCFIL